MWKNEFFIISSGVLLHYLFRPGLWPFLKMTGVMVFMESGLSPYQPLRAGLCSAFIFIVKDFFSGSRKDYPDNVCSKIMTNF